MGGWARYVSGAGVAQKRKLLLRGASLDDVDEGGDVDDVVCAIVVDVGCVVVVVVLLFVSLLDDVDEGGDILHVDKSVARDVANKFCDDDFGYDLIGDGDLTRRSYRVGSKSAEHRALDDDRIDARLKSAEVDGEITELRVRSGESCVGH